MKGKYAEIPVQYADAIDDFVASGEYASRNEFVREAVRDKLIARGMLRITSLKKPLEVDTHG
ncbi:MAG: ribbon-helix-helix domain-containing protein [Candidatus Thorarchaeota archaeon]